MTGQPSLFDPPVVPKHKRHRTAPNAVDAGATVPDDIRATQRRKIVSVLAADGALTYHDIAARTCIELQTVCWRMKELRESCTVRFARDESGAYRKQGHRKLVELAPLKRSA